MGKEMLPWLKEIMITLEYSNRVLDIDSKNIDALYNKGMALYDLSTFDKDIESFNHALDLNFPHNVKLLLWKGNSLREQSKLIGGFTGYNGAASGNYTKALETYDTALSIDPNNAEVLINKGNTYEKQGKYEKAIQLTISYPERGS